MTDHVVIISGKGKGNVAEIVCTGRTSGREWLFVHYGDVWCFKTSRTTRALDERELAILRMA